MQEGNAATESMGRSVLSSQFVAGLLPPLKSKLAGVEGDFEKLLVKARFEEAKLREFASSSAPPKKVSINPENKPGNQSQSENQSQSNKSENKSQPTEATRDRRHPSGLRCDICDSPNHLRRRCPFRRRGAPGEASGSNQRVSAVVESAQDSKGSLAKQEEELDVVLGEATALMHGVAATDATESVKLGPVITTDVQIEGEKVSALVDTGSPVTIVSLRRLVKILAKKRQPHQSPAQWRRSVEKRMMPPTLPYPYFVMGEES